MTTNPRPEEPRSQWHDLLDMNISRRGLFKGAVAAGLAATFSPIVLRAAYAQAGNPPAPSVGSVQGQWAAGIPFAPIKPSTEDRLIVASPLRGQVFAKWGDDIGTGKIGFNHDWTGFYPINMLDMGYDLKAVQRGFTSRSMSSVDGIFALNHEYVNPMLVSQYDGKSAKTASQLKAEAEAVGMSFFRLKRDAKTGQWSIDTKDARNRRYDGTSEMLLTGPAAALDGGPKAVGTLANCSGGQTPWGTALSCEENFQDYAPEAPLGYGWDKSIYSKRHYGYVVEIDPYDPKAMPRKHTAMGRFRHENVAIAVGKDGTVVAYMGDDRADSCVYKFVADKKLGDAKNRAQNLTILESGKLYVADFGNGKWVLLDLDKQARLKDAKDKDGKPVYSSQAEVLADARGAALLVGGTPVDRPEDIEINPVDSSVFVALTNNTGHGNFHGQIVRLVEDKNDPASETFSWSVFAVGGPQSGFSSPDNLVFDARGDLWMVTDTSTSRLNKGIYKFMGNNGLFYFKTTGPQAGKAYLMASGPVECEMTGPTWTPDGSTLFLSVQHPGEESQAMDMLSSHWPEGGTSVPKPACVAITGFPRNVY